MLCHLAGCLYCSDLFFQSVLFFQTWECHRSWLHCIDFLQEKELEFSRQYHYRVRWSIPTRRKPIPRATACVYFIIEISKVKPPVGTVGTAASHYSLLKQEALATRYLLPRRAQRSILKLWYSSVDYLKNRSCGTGYLGHIQGFWKTFPLRTRSVTEY